MGHGDTQAITHEGKHGGSWKKQVAEDNTILRVQVGSGVHGTNVAGTDDRDEIGICIPPPEFVLGLKKFEQYEHHTAWEREGGLKNRSGPGDLDITIYELKKFLSLALNGNPSIITVLFAPEDSVVTKTGLGENLLEMTPYIISKEAGPRFLGYLEGQRRSLLSHEGKGRDVTRPELVEKYGFDTKFGGHMIRLGYQGIELMRTGKITLPMPQDEREKVLACRRGEMSMQECLDYTELLEQDLKWHLDFSPLQDHPNRDLMNRWLGAAQLGHWQEKDLLH